MSALKKRIDSYSMSSVQIMYVPMQGWQGKVGMGIGRISHRIETAKGLNCLY